MPPRRPLLRLQVCIIILQIADKIAQAQLSSHFLSPRDPLMALIALPPSAPPTCRDAPVLQVTANCGRPDQRPPGINASLTFSGVCWRGLNGRVGEQSGDILASLKAQGSLFWDLERGADSSEALPGLGRGNQ